jgi:hypothetical protein
MNETQIFSFPWPPPEQGVFSVKKPEIVSRFKAFANHLGQGQPYLCVGSAIPSIPAQGLVIYRIPAGISYVNVTIHMGSVIYLVYAGVSPTLLYSKQN